MDFIDLKTQYRRIKPSVDARIHKVLDHGAYVMGPEVPAPPADAESVVAIVPSGPDQEYNANALVYFAGVASASKRVYLTSPYFIPDEPLIRALVTAAMRGVDVRLLLPEKPDVLIVGSAAQAYHKVLVRAGVKIFEYVELPTPPAQTGRLSVVTRPPGAEIFVDGTPRGVSPIELADLTAGAHRVTLRNAQTSVDEKVLIEPGVTSSLFVPLGTQAGSFGWLSVSHRPCRCRSTRMAV